MLSMPSRSASQQLSLIPLASLQIRAAPPEPDGFDGLTDKKVRRKRRKRERVQLMILS
jgi:hypothetical protein